MTRMTRRNAVLGAGLSALSAPSVAAGSFPRLADRPLYAIGVSVPDLDQAVAAYQRVFGIVPTPFGVGAVSTPTGETVRLNMSVVFLSDFYIKLQQPLSENGPWADHLRRQGLSIQNLQVAVAPELMSDLRAGLQQKGGRWTLGTATDPWAYVDFQDRLGVTLEPCAPPPTLRGRAISRAPDAGPSPLGALPFSHVGLAVADVRRSAQAYSDVFGRPVPPVVTREGLGIPPEQDWSRGAAIQVAAWSQGGAGIELVGSRGRSPWSDHVRRKGDAAYAVGFEAGERLGEMVRELEGRGGKLIYGGPADRAVLIDFSSTLGLVIELRAAPSRT